MLLQSVGVLPTGTAKGRNCPSAPTSFLNARPWGQLFIISGDKRSQK